MTRVFGVLALSVLVLSACGGGAAPSASSTTPATAAAATAANAAVGQVTVQGFSFKPSPLEVRVGTKVTWTNTDAAGHTTTSGTPSAKDGKWDSELAGSTGTFSFTFAQVGSFAYFCQRHPSTMTGTVVVK